ncbi:MAG: hypothetical protein ABR555_05705, partial [Pyrinomonadaceae bacterium]
MIDWLRLLLMMFYAPVRGMRLMRDRVALAPIAFIAFLSQLAYAFVTKHFAGSRFAFAPVVFSDVFQGAITLVLIALVLVPILTLVANFLEKRGSFRVVLTQEYAPVTASIYYIYSVTNIVTLLIAVVLHYSGAQAAYVASTMANVDQILPMV